jgi:hypothetical protein
MLLSLLVFPPLLAAAGRGRTAAWSALGVGGLLVLMNSLAGIFHGMHDNALYLLIASSIAILLPGFFALKSNWTWARSL